MNTLANRCLDLHQTKDLYVYKAPLIPGISERSIAWSYYDIMASLQSFYLCDFYKQIVELI
jgi:hypothetical protein